MSLLLELLETGGVQYRPTAKEDEYVVCCPFCPDDQEYKLGLNIHDGRAHCFRCEFKSSGVLNTTRIFCQELGINFNPYALIAYQEDEKKPTKEKPKRLKPTGLPKEYELFTGSNDELEQKAYTYLIERGVIQKQIEEHMIGFASEGFFAYRIIFPVIGRKNKVYGCVGRNFTERGFPKYLNTPGLKMMWGCHRKGKVAVVCEGIFDAMSVERSLNIDGVVGVCRLGSSLTDIQLIQLKRYEEVVLLPDWDQPGIKGVRKLATLLQEEGLKVKVAIPDKLNGEDPGSLPKATLVEQYYKSKPWSRTTEMRLRVIPHE